MPSGRNLGSRPCVSSETGARNECEAVHEEREGKGARPASSSWLPLGIRRRERLGRQDRPARETARGYGIRLDTVQDLPSSYSMMWSRHRRHAQAGAWTSLILSHPLRQLGDRG